MAYIRKSDRNKVKPENELKLKAFIRKIDVKHELYNHRRKK